MYVFMYVFMHACNDNGLQNFIFCLFVCLFLYQMCVRICEVQLYVCACACVRVQDVVKCEYQFKRAHTCACVRASVCAAQVPW